MEEEPNSPEPPFFLCKSYGMEKQSAEAIYYGLVARHRLELALENCPKDKSAKARIHAAFGITWEVIGESDKAALSFSLALEFDKDNSEANHGLKRIKDKSHKGKKNKGKKKGHGRNG